jgi:hypothetical protein
LRAPRLVGIDSSARFCLFNIYIYTQLYLELLNDSEAEVRAAAIKNIAGYCKLVGETLFVSEVDGDLRVFDSVIEPGRLPVLVRRLVHFEVE